MSKNRASDTSQSIVAISQQGIKYFPENAVFIRQLRANDAREIAILLQKSEYIVEDESPQYGIFDGSSCLVGMYETSEEAFRESLRTRFVLHWVH